MDKGLEYNYVLTVAVISWCAAQVLKTIIHFVQYRRFRPERLLGAGGMPSSHSALVCSATVAVARQAGVGSPIFAIMFVLALVVMYDAMGVRRAAGQHAKEINRMNRWLEGADIDYSKENVTPELKEFLGHTPFQVVAGAILGILVSLIVPIELIV